MIKFKKLLNDLFFNHTISSICWSLKWQETSIFPFLVNSYPILQIITDKLDNNISFLIVWLPIMIYVSLWKITKKKVKTPHSFWRTCIWERRLSRISSVVIWNFMDVAHILQKKGLVSVRELPNVVELVNVEETPSVRFASQGRKMKILEYCWF